MIEFLQRVLNAQLAVTLLAGAAATALRSHDLIPAEVWKDVVNTALTMFVGGGLLKEAATAFANRGAA